MIRSLDYDEIAETYDRRYTDNEYRGIEQSLLEFVRDGARPRVLDVGCGTGYWAARLHRWGCCVAGLDISYEMLRRAAGHEVGEALVQGRAEQLPWRDASFDRVVCVNAFHHFRDKTAFLAEARRILRSGGRMMTIGLDPHTRLDQWFIYEYFEGTLEIDKERYPPTSEIRSCMRAVGFVDCVTIEVQRIPMDLSARETLERGRINKSVTSQLAILSDEEYQRGIDRIWRDIRVAEARGEVLCLTSDLRLYGTVGNVGLTALDRPRGEF